MIAQQSLDCEAPASLLNYAGSSGKNKAAQVCRSPKAAVTVMDFDAKQSVDGEATASLWIIWTLNKK
jgi:hypothetical protein